MDAFNEQSPRVCTGIQILISICIPRSILRILLVNFYFDTIASRVDGESWTDVGKTRQGGEVADER